MAASGSAWIAMWGDLVAEAGFSKRGEAGGLICAARFLGDSGIGNSSGLDFEFRDSIPGWKKLQVRIFDSGMA